MNIEELVKDAPQTRPSVSATNTTSLGLLPSNAATLPLPESHSETKENKAICVLLVDDHTIVRQGIRVLLEYYKEFKVVGEADTGRRAIQLTKELNPDIVLMDIAMPELNGIESTRQIIKEFPLAKVIALSCHDDDIHITEVMKAGAVGYLIKQTAANDLIIALKEVQNGKAVFSPSIEKRLKNNCRNGFEHGQLPGEDRIKLTSRELEVLQLIAEGYANKQIASELIISIKTVEKHRQRVMDKLNIHETAGLTRYAILNKISESHVQEECLQSPLPSKKEEDGLTTGDSPAV